MTGVTVNWQIVYMGGLNLVALVGGLWGLYYGLKADNAKLSSDVALAMLTQRNDLTSLVAKGEAYVKDLEHRVSTLESGQDEWTKALRKRTHELAGDLQNLALKVDRLERPHLFVAQEKSS